MKLSLKISLVLLLRRSSVCYAQKMGKGDNDIIIIEGQVPPEYKQDVITLTKYPLDLITYNSEEVVTLEKTISKGYVKWSFSSDKPLGIYGPFIGDATKVIFCLEAGDSVSIKYSGGRPVYSGKGALKFELIYQLRRIEDSLRNTPSYKELSYAYTPLRSINDYFLWNTYLNSKIDLILNVIDGYKGKISKVVYDAVKEMVLCDIEEKRLDRFIHLIATNVSDSSKNTRDLGVNQFGLSNGDLCAVYDSTLNGIAAKWLQHESPIVGDPQYLYSFVKLEAYRQRGKFFKYAATDTPILAKSKEDDYLIRYNLAKKMFSGVIREEILSYFFHSPVGALHNLGFHPQIEDMLADYYSQPGYAEYKAVVRKYEIKRRRILADRNNLDFSLTGMNGENFYKEGLRGKIALLNFWYTGCKECAETMSIFSKVAGRFAKDTNVIFLNVSMDGQRDMWINSLKDNKYVTGNRVNLYTGGKGKMHSITRDFGIDQYPMLLLFDALGNPIYPESDVKREISSEENLVNVIKQQLVLMKDGPYVTYDKGKISSCSINGMSIFCKTVNDKNAMRLEVQTDKLEKRFAVFLKDSINVEPSEFPMPRKLLALSDIEGNFDALSNLLMANKVIDDDYKWTFGDGHLVFVGDMFDRGDQVTECLWLLYKLEEEAKYNGGYIHFVLGNHEIMNLQGNIKYVREKYKVNAGLMRDSIAGLYSTKSELGRWLRTKNIVEKIGDLLFVHAGISRTINKSSVSLADINNLARMYYGRIISKLDTICVRNIMGLVGPFWYRGYYQTDAKDDYIDTTLEKFSINRIVTGHTIVGDNITIHHDGKVINIDTDHKRGKSEALLIENNIYYRVNGKGERKILPLDLYPRSLSSNTDKNYGELTVSE